MDRGNLSIVIPVRNMAGKLSNLIRWLSEIRSKDIQIVLIHDFAEYKTQLELEQILLLILKVLVFNLTVVLMLVYVL